MTQGNQQNPNPQNRDEQKPYQQRPGQQNLGQQNPQNPAKQNRNKGSSAGSRRAAVHGSNEQHAFKKNVADENRQSRKAPSSDRKR